MSLEIKGTIKKIGELETFASGFQKRELILLTQEQYPQPISIEFLQDKISILDNVSEGDNIKVGINIRGREWTSPQGETKYFNSITGWRIERLEGEGNAKSEPSGKIATATPAEAFLDEDDLDSSLPF